VPVSGKRDLQYSNGNYYIGELDEDRLPSGRGDFYLENDSVPCGSGEWLRGKQHGQGIYISRNGERYEGAFFEDQPTGLGKQTKPDGSTYEGQFVNGTRTGHGTETGKDGKETNTGQWYLNKLVQPVTI